MQFYLKAQAGWSEKRDLELSKAEIANSDNRCWTVSVV